MFIDQNERRKKTQREKEKAGRTRKLKMSKERLKDLDTDSTVCKYFILLFECLNQS